MKSTYYTSLCSAWLDHEVLSIPAKEESLTELIYNGPNTTERICEWLIDQMQAQDNSGMRNRVLAHMDDIDIPAIAKILYGKIVEK